MSGKNDDILSEFAEFLNQRSRKDKGNEEGIEYVEVFDANGRGARVPAWRAKEYLESLGIDVSGCGSDDADDSANDDDDSDDNDVRISRPPVGRQSRHVADRLANSNEVG